MSVTRRSWYLARLRGMSPGEVATRLRHAAVKARWRRRRWPASAVVTLALWRGTPVTDAAVSRIDAGPREALLTTAEEIMAGRVRLFGRVHPSLGAEPDWFVDIRSGKRAPATGWCFDVPYRNPAVVGDNKQVWEPSRHFHLTQLAAAWRMSGDVRFAERIKAHLEDWWDQNPPLTGMHWTSGIELGMRLLAWCWTRRLLAGWPGAAELFERNMTFRRQLWMHQTYLATLSSPGSSANNHLVAELSGLFVAATAFPLFAESGGWRVWARRKLEREIVRQTFPDGLNRELASEYHPYVLELFLMPYLETGGAGFSLRYVERLAAMADALAATLDAAGHPPRQGDADGAEGLLVDGTGFDRVASLLETCRTLFGAPAWWPLQRSLDVRAAVWSAAATPEPVAARAAQRPSLFADAGMVLLRDHEDAGDALWCRCDHGPHGFLSIAGHAHADALSIELRCGAVEVLADPGTYCYASEPPWRDWERSTAAHNTLELFGRDQADSAGPFLWSNAPRTRLTGYSGLDEGDVAHWSAEHDGYARVQGDVLHRRAVALHRTARRLTIEDAITGRVAAPARLCFQLGPAIAVDLEGTRARLRWEAGGVARGARMILPPTLAWSVHTGETEPPRGWHSAHFGDRQPAPLLVGAGTIAPGETLRTLIEFGAPEPARASTEVRHG